MATRQQMTPTQIERLRHDPPLYTTLEEIAVVIQVHPRTVLRYVEARRIPVMNKGRHALLFDTKKVLDALAKCS